MDAPAGRSMADLPEGVLSRILDTLVNLSTQTRRGATRSFKLLFAQVCCSWKDAFYRLPHLRLLPSRAAVLEELTEFKQLTSLDFSDGSIEQVNDGFFHDLARVVEQSSLRLKHLSVNNGDPDAFLTKVSPEGLPRLFAAAPGLKSLRLLWSAPRWSRPEEPPPWMVPSFQPRHLPQYEIPDSLSMLSCLEDLELMGVKTLPSSFGQGLPKLHSLHLRSPHLQHFPESFACLTTLRCLELDCRHLDLTDRTLLAILPGPHELMLKAAGIPDSFFDAVGNLPQFRCLTLHQVEISLPLLRRCSHLRWLRLFHNSITSISNEVLFLVTELRELHLRVPWVEELPSSLGALRRLTKLCLQSTDLRELPDSISHLQPLRTLVICTCERLRELPSRVSNLRSLENLALRWMHSVQGTLEEVGRVSSLKRVELYMLPEPTVLGDSWGALPKLESLKIAWCTNLQSLPGDMAGLRSLRLLHLHYLPALLAIPESLTCATTLEAVKVLQCPELRSVPQGLIALVQPEEEYWYGLDE